MRPESEQREGDRAERREDEHQDDRAVRREAEAAAAEAARIGGAGGQDSDGDPAWAPIEEAGGGEAEGFEQAEEALIEHASHGDQQSTHVVLHDRGPAEEEAAGMAADGEADHERSSERPLS